MSDLDKAKELVRNIHSLTATIAPTLELIDAAGAELEALVFEFTDEQIEELEELNNELGGEQE